METRRPSAVERFTAAASQRGIAADVRRFPEGTRTAADAARAVGCDIGAIVKSLVFVAGDTVFVALTSGRNRADTSRLAEIVGSSVVRTAGAEEARRATGFAIGGTPPLGYPEALAVLIDRDLLAYDIVWAAAGAPDAVFPISPGELIRAANAAPADFKELQAS